MLGMGFHMKFKIHRSSCYAYVGCTSHAIIHLQCVKPRAAFDSDCLPYDALTVSDFTACVTADWLDVGCVGLVGGMRDACPAAAYF